MKTKIDAPAKINLTLEVVDKRNDGYHIIKSLMQTISLYDEITLEKTESNDIKIICNNDKIPTDNRNVAYRISEAFFEYTNLKNTGILIEIDKRIPLEAGLAGGSADAAGTIVALNRIFDTNLDIDTMCDIAQEVGADIPFCIMGGTMIAEGIGNILTPIPNLPKCFFVVAKPNISVSTKKAYQLVDECQKSWRNNYTDEAAEAVCSGSIDRLVLELYNKFEDVVDKDKILAIKDIMLKFGAKGTLMTGSGPTVFGIFESKGDADDAVDELEKTYNEVFLCRPVDHGTYEK